MCYVKEKNSDSPQKNKLIEVKAADAVAAKKKILKLLTKLNSEIITVRPVTEEDKNAN